MQNGLPNFYQLVGSQVERLNGIGSWENLEKIGKNNLERIVQLAQETIHRMMSEHESASEMKQIRKAIDHIKNDLIPNLSNKPTLPKLRNESFRQKDVVLAYLGDTHGTIVEKGWVQGKVIDVSKAFNKDWADGKANSGYFWKVTVETAKNIFPNDHQLVFSTSEPRVIFDWEYDYLKNGGDADFLQIYSDNAFREWKPLWCLERNLDCDASSMNMRSWITGEKVTG